MTKIVYTPDKQMPLRHILSPLWIFRDLWAHRELIVAYANREYEAAHRNTFLGAAWAMLTPLIMLALFTFVFGYIFQGRFNAKIEESPADFALALFVGLSFFTCIGTALGAGPGLMFSAATYVKTLSFPIEVFSVAQTYNIIKNLLISLGLCLAAFFLSKGFIHWTVIFVVLHIIVVTMMVLALSWFLSAVAVFFPDTAAITGPLSMILMFLSGVFFSIDNMSPKMQLMFKLNPLATIIQQARKAILYGVVPDFKILALVALVSFISMIFGYYVFSRLKSAFADVL